MARHSYINQEYIDDLYDRIITKDRLALAKAITLIESSNEKHRPFAKKLLEKCLLKSVNSVRIGITGTPGVGKSTFIEAIGQQYIQAGHRLAVLTIDPTSPIHHGSILGDKSRMDLLSNDPMAFVRSSPSRAVLGGTTDQTQETIILCEAAGYNLVFVETVGIGQSETEILNMVDFLILLVLPGSGDEIQGIKRGIVEVADLIVINKADRNNETLVKETLSAYKFALHLKKIKDSKWASRVFSCSALTKMGLDNIEKTIEEFIHVVKENGYFEVNRRRQMITWFYKILDKDMLSKFKKLMNNQVDLENIDHKISNNEWSPYEASDQLLKKLFPEKDT